MIITKLNALNVVLNLYNCLIILLVICFLIPKAKNNKPNTCFLICNIFFMIFALADTVTWLFDGTKNPLFFLILKVSMFIFYLTQPLMFLSFIKFMKVYMTPKKDSIYFWISIDILIFIYAIALFFTPSQGIFYYFNSDFLYCRGKYQFLSVLINGIILFSGFVYLMLNHKQVTTIELFCFFLFFFIPTVSEFIQLMNYGISLIITGLTIPIILIFMNIHTKLENNLATIIDQSVMKEEEIIKIKDNTILGLSNLVENRDKDNGNHVKRIMKYVELLCRQCVKNGVYADTIDEAYIQRLIKSVPMHDIGKIVVPDEILVKKGQLSVNDINQIQKHVTEGAKIVNEVLSYEKDKKLVKMTENVVLFHHEKWDGTGYPKGLKNRSIPLSARIMAIADVFDALVTSRIYKEETLNIEDAFSLIKNNSEKSFDPQLIKQFELIENEIKKVVEEYGV